MGGFGVHAEEKGTGQGVGDQRHGDNRRITWIFPHDDICCLFSQDELKALVGQAALAYVAPGEIVGVGTGSTVNKFIDALATIKDQIPGAVSSSVASTERLKALGIKVLDANEVDRLSVYIDGADEIDGRGYMVKGGARH